MSSEMIGKDKDLHLNDTATNTLTQLLNSAVANAATETSSDDSLEAAELSNPSNSRKRYVYTIEDLMALRNSPSNINTQITDALPDKGFWRSKTKPQLSYNNTKEFKHKKGNHGKKHISENWERKPIGFNKANDLDSLSEDKISQLLGESGDEGVPEWDSSNLNDEMQMDMGQTIEDFEKWKSLMKKEERRKKGQNIDAESLTNDIYTHDSLSEMGGNEVDSFFSFVKPKASEKNSKSNTSSGQPTPVETPGKSSRFSSFFSVTTSEIPHNNATRGPKIPSQHEQSANELSKFFQSSGPSKVTSPHLSTASQNQNMQNRLSNDSVHQEESLQQMDSPSVIEPRVKNSATNDSFFMSLLNKKDPKEPNTEAVSLKSPMGVTKNISTALNAPQSPFQQTNTQAHAASQSQNPHVQHFERHEPSMSLQKLQSQMPGHGIPPWMNQLRNSNMPGPPLPPHMQYNPHMNGQILPPPGTYPPGFIPPNMIPPPPHFADISAQGSPQRVIQNGGLPPNGPHNRNSGVPPNVAANGRANLAPNVVPSGVFPQGQFYGFPPGMPPPHLQQSQQEK
ncbi:uncharacterized protein PRCAT00001815001 [Priceomyces carsonii]|uniref:uncharacterized protein n=1 Tax=Priceomyces carsonii TaxID=28549 RepID=UPI002ED983A0|nr:unnamed protein product [Priceomyces carsonii]